MYAGTKQPSIFQHHPWGKNVVPTSAWAKVPFIELRRAYREYLRRHFWAKRECGSWGGSISGISINRFIARSFYNENDGYSMMRKQLLALPTKQNDSVFPNLILDIKGRSSVDQIHWHTVFSIEALNCHKKAFTMSNCRIFAPVPWVYPASSSVTRKLLKT